MESHGRDIVFADFTAQDYLYYTIRFENTGNGNAVNIQVDNTLDVKLDETTMEMVSSSHDYVMDRVGSSVNWKFANIQLPPSVAETTTGKGYIMYKIKPKPGYAIGDIIPNSAAIYFDFNPAIITNTFNTEFTAPLGIVDFESDEFVVYPNPASEKITVQLKNKNDGITLIQIYDQLGRIIQTIPGRGAAEEEGGSSQFNLAGKACLAGASCRVSHTTTAPVNKMAKPANNQ
jgi:uncharacterized repeat protein (TIGR01451 family)